MAVAFPPLLALIPRFWLIWARIRSRLLLKMRDCFLELIDCLARVPVMEKPARYWRIEE